LEKAGQWLCFMTNSAALQGIQWLCLQHAISAGVEFHEQQIMMLSCDA
jgi:hypothetical protein